MANKAENNIGIELLRIIAISLLIIYHTTLIGSVGSYPSYLNAILTITKMGWLGTDIFLAISGFFCVSAILKAKNENKTYISYLKSRALRFVPAYYLFIFLYLIFGVDLINSLGNGFVLNDGLLVGLLTFTSNIFYANSQWSGVALEGMFSIALLIQLVIIFSGILFFISKRSTLLIIFLSFELVAIGLRLYFGSQDHWRSYFFVFTRMDAFLMGLTLGVLYTYTQVKAQLLNNALIIFCSAIIMFTLMVYFTKGMFLGNALTTYLAYPAIAFFAVSLINLLYRYEINTLWLKKASIFGKISYPIYLLKLPAVYFIYSVLLIYAADLNPVAFIGIFFIASLTFCFLVGGVWYLLYENLKNMFKTNIQKRNLKALNCK